MAKDLPAHPAVMPTPEHGEHRVALVAHLTHFVLAYMMGFSVNSSISSGQQQNKRRNAESSSDFLAQNANTMVIIYIYQLSSRKARERGLETRTGEGRQAARALIQS